MNNEEGLRVKQVIITSRIKMTSIIKETMRNFGSSKIRSKKGTIMQR